MTHFDAEELLETARQQTGLADFGSADFREPFGVLITALNHEADIAPARASNLRQRLLRLLQNRLWFAKDVLEHPEILDEDLGVPVVISTMPRTGSTKLHRLLAASGDFQTLSFWKAHMPSRIPGEPDGGTVRRIAETREHEQWMYETSPAILTGHPQFTDEAEEDQWLMEQSFHHPILFGMFEMPSYLQWLMQADIRPTFDYFRQQLQYLQWQSPENRGKAWLIKSPTHFGYEQRLLDIFGNLRLIVTHRDPAKCVTSITSTSMAVRRLYSDRNTGPGLVHDITAMFSHAAVQHMAWRDAHPDIPALDLNFRDVATAGLDSAKAVYGFLGMEMSAVAEAQMRQWETENSVDKHGKSHYAAADYGTTDEHIRASYVAYQQRFAGSMV